MTKYDKFVDLSSTIIVGVIGGVLTRYLGVEFGIMFIAILIINRTKR